MSNEQTEGPKVTLHASLADVVGERALDIEKLRLGYAAKPVMSSRHEVLISDGEKDAIWKAPTISELYRGDKLPPADIERYPLEYVPYFRFIELHFLYLCDIAGDKTDQEMEEVYGALSKNPDGRRLGFVHDYMWQAGALLLATLPLSQPEYQGLMRTLHRSTRTWSARPVSRFYIEFLRTNNPS